MRYVVSASLLVAGIIHLFPLTGVVGAGRLEALYGVAFEDPTTLVLMRHRAVLFGLLGCLLVYAVLRPGLRTVAFALGLASVLSFIVLAGFDGWDFSREIHRVVQADWIALLALGAGAVAHAAEARRPRTVMSTSRTE
jgi:hypothetical protein